jgi:hypothetical protein
MASSGWPVRPSHGGAKELVVRRLAGLVVALFGLTSSLLAAAPPTSVEVLERFAVHGDGDFLIVPVTIKGKVYRFILDTGCSSTVYDSSLRPLLGPHIDRIEIKGAQSTAELERYAAPAAFVGKLPLPQTEPAMVYDLRSAYHCAGVDVCGCLGMDFLKQHVVRIDFDAGLLIFQKGIGHEQGQPLRLHSGEITDVPYVNADVCDSSPPEPFEVDTGDGGEGTLGADLFTALCQLGKLKRVGQCRCWALKEHTAQEGQLVRLKLGSLEHQGLIFSSGRDSRLGLGFLSRYRVTFDFPAGFLYLCKRKDFDHPSYRNRSGLHLHRAGGETVVESVDPDSPADKAGVKPDDILLSIGTLQADGARLFTLRQHLCSAGQTVPITLKRGDKQLKVFVQLEADR